METQAPEKPSSLLPLLPLSALPLSSLPLLFLSLSLCLHQPTEHLSVSVSLVAKVISIKAEKERQKGQRKHFVPIYPLGISK